jgi:hypothetical protein
MIIGEFLGGQRGSAIRRVTGLAILCDARSTSGNQLYIEEIYDQMSIGFSFTLRSMTEIGRYLKYSR